MSDVASSSADAPTTLPNTLFATTWWQRIGGTISSPLSSFRALIDDPRAHPLEPVAVYSFVVLCVAAAEVFRLLALAGTAPLIVVRRLLDVVLRAGRTDLAITLATALVIAGVARALGHSLRGAFIATSYLLVPLAVLKAVGGALAFAGLELWWLPHRAVDSFAVVVDQRFDVTRFVVKCVIAYLPGLAVLGAWLATQKKELAPPRAFVARMGLAVVVVAAGAVFAGAVINVAGRTDVLKPKLVGDAFPSLPLKRLGAKGRVDITKLAEQEKASVVVVDFWASWCGPCRRSMPELSKLNEAWQANHPDGGVVVIGVNREPSDLEAAQKAWDEMKPSFASLVDDRGLGERVGLTSLPSSYVLDASGTIRHLHLGYTDADTIKAEVERLLVEQKK